MKTVKINIEETFKYRRGLIVSVPDELSDNELQQIIAKTERTSDQASDIPFELKKLNDKIIINESPDEDLESPDDMSVEITDFNIVHP